MHNISSYVTVLKSEGHEICGLFYNPNIHPYLEYTRRLDALKTCAVQEKLSFSYSGEYPMETFLREVAYRVTDRCHYCYEDRLAHTVQIASENKYDGFTTTLLYSRYQNHDIIKNIGTSLAITHNIRFYYRDFREEWTKGIRISKDKEIYRQPYCGCIYSEKERYYKI